MKIRQPFTRPLLSALLATLLLGACGDKPEVLLASAKEYMAKNDNKAAVIQIKNALQVNPDLAEARFLLGSALLDSGDPVGAETELRKALDLKYSQEAVVPRLAQALLAQSDARKLTDEFAKVQLTQPAGQASLQTYLATAYAMQGQPEQSQTSLNAALQADPGFGPALIQQARQKAGQRDFDGAMALVDDVLAKDPRSVDGWKIKGDLQLYAYAKMDDALASYRKALAVQPDFLSGHVSVISILLQQEKLTETQAQIDQLKTFAPNHAQTKYLEARLAFQKKDYTGARELSQQVLKTAPKNVQALQLAGAVELQLNSLVQAEDYLGKAVQFAPELVSARRLLITTYLRSGQAAKALAALQPALSKEPIHPDFLAIAGEVYLQNGDVQKAEALFSKAAQASPDNARARTSLAVTRLMGGRVESGFDELRDVARSDEGITADMALISAHLRRQEFDKALKAIDGLEKKQPDKPMAAVLRGRTLLVKKDTAGARQSFERALTIDATFFPAVASLAALDVAEQKPEQATKRFEALRAKDPKNAQVVLALAELAARAGAPKEEVGKLLNEAVAANPSDVAPRVLLVDFHLRQKDNKSALAAAQTALAVHPDSPELLDVLGRAQMASGDLNQAITTYNKLAGLQPASAQPHMRLADVHMAGKNKAAAAQSLRKALELQPGLLAAQRGSIMLDMDAKNYASALATARAIQKQSPKEDQGYLLEGEIFAIQKNWDSAVNAFRQGMKQANSPGLAIKLHSTLLAANKTAEADKVAQAWQKEFPKDAVFYLYLADNAIGSKDYALAEKHYLTVTKLQPNGAAAAYNNLAWVTAKLGKPGAVAYAEKALALAPDQPAFMDTLAGLLSEQGDYAKALALQTKVLAAQPQVSIFKLNLAKIHLKGGQKDLARKELESLLKPGAEFPEQAEASALLKTL